MTDRFTWDPPTPRELPALRDALATQMRSPLEHQMLTQMLTVGRGTLSPNTGDAGQDAAVLLREEFARLRQAQLFYVSAEMTHLSQAAARTLTAASTHPDDLPSEAGLMIFAEPIAAYEPDPYPGEEHVEQCQIVAVSWGPNGVVAAHEGMWLTFWSATDFEAEARHARNQLGCSQQEASRFVRQHRAELSWDNETICGHPVRNTRP